MLQLRPTESFPITRQLDDPSDSNTYYVRAYIRNAATDDLLDTIDLTDQGDQRFTGAWEVQVDGKGEGYYVTVLSKVFTDSGYTTESKRYARSQQQFLVQERWNRFLGGAGGGADIDYKKVRKIIQEELKKLKLPEPKIIKQTKYNTVKEEIKIDLGPITEGLKQIRTDIINIPKLIKPKEPEKVDLNPLITKIENTQALIKGIKIPEVDFSELIKLLEELKKYFSGKDEVVSKTLELINRNTKPLKKDKVKENLKRRRERFLGKDFPRRKHFV